MTTTLKANGYTIEMIGGMYFVVYNFNDGINKPEIYGHGYRTLSGAHKSLDKVKRMAGISI